MAAAGRVLPRDTQKRYTELEKATVCSASDKKRIQSPFNLKRRDRGAQLQGPDPAKKRNKNSNTTPSDFLKNLWLLVETTKEDLKCFSKRF